MNSKILIRSKKIMSSALMFLMVGSNMAFIPTAMALALTPTLTIGSQSAVNGVTIHVPISATNFSAFASNVGSVTLTVQYDNALLTYVDTTFNNLPAGASASAGGSNPVVVNWVDNTGSNPISLNDGAISTLNFVVNSSATVNTDISFDVSTEDTSQVMDSTFNLIGTTFAKGTISLNPAATLSSIAITNPPNKLSYTVGDALDITGLVVTGTYSDGSTKVESITAANVTGFDSSVPVNSEILTITAGGKTTTYTVNIVAPLSSAKDMTSFSFPEGSGVIIGTNIAVSVPFGTNVAALIPTIVISPKASVNPASGAAQNFTNPVAYTVTAENSSTQVYTVTVSTSANPDIALLASDKTALTDNSIKGSNVDVSNITSTLTNPLPASGANGSTITWTSSNPAVVSNDGQTINRPAFVASNATITLTATLTKGVVTDTKVFTLTVLKLSASTVATITSGAYTVSAGGTGSETIINVPFGTTKTDFLSALTKGESNQTFDSTDIADPVVTGNTLKVIAQDGVTNVTYTLTTSDNPDIAKVSSDRDALVNDAIKGTNPDLLNVTSNLTNPLPSIGSVNGSTVTWESSNASIVSNDGQTINRPAFADGDATVTLTATITKGAITQTKIFTLIVLKLSASTVATITSGAYTVSAGGTGSETIVDVPFGTLKATFLAALAKGEAHQAWNSTNIADPVVTGNTLKITAQDGTTEVVYTITVVPDIINPTGLITNISADSYLKGTVTLNATASDIGSGVSKVEFWYASVGTKIGEDTTAPYSIDWNTTKEGEIVPDGSHSLFIKVYDNAGNSYQSDSIPVTIDNAAPTVTKLGDNSTDLSLSVGNTDLTFSEALSNSSKTAVQNALTAGADKILNYSWTGATLTITATEITTFANDVVVNVSDLAGNLAQLLLVDSSLSPTQTTPNGSGTATADSSTPQVVITNPTQAVMVTITGGTANPTIDVGSFVSGGTGVVPSITINSTLAGVAIPASTTITSADPSWDGVIASPTIATVTLPQVSGETRTLEMAVEVGFTGAKLSFNKGVRLLLPGQSGKRAGYILPGTAFTEITNTCGADDQSTGDALAVDGECKISVGSDLVIWTKHFTSFATFSSVTTVVNAGNTGSGGGGGGSSSAPTPQPITTTPNQGKVLGVQTQLFPDGTIMKIRGQMKYFYIQDGERKSISVAEFKKKYSKGNVLLLDKNTIEQIPLLEVPKVVTKTVTKPKITKKTATKLKLVKVNLPAKILIEVMYRSVKIRNGIGDNAKTIDGAVKGQHLEVIEERNGWFNIVWGNIKSAWIDGRWVKKIS